MDCVLICVLDQPTRHLRRECDDLPHELLEMLSYWLLGVLRANHKWISDI